MANLLVYKTYVKTPECVCGQALDSEYPRTQPVSQNIENEIYINVICPNCGTVNKLHCYLMTQGTYVPPVDQYLIGDYEMDEGAAAAIGNSSTSTNALPAGVVNDPINGWFVDPTKGPVLAHSDAAGTWYATIAVPALDWSLGITMMVWSWHTVVGTGFHGVLSMDDGIITYDLGLRKDFSGPLDSEWLDAPVPVTPTPNPIPNSQWVFNAISLQAGAMGAPVPSKSYFGIGGLNTSALVNTPTTLPTAIPYTITIGIATINPWFMDGYTSKFMIWNRALTDAEIQAWYDQQKIMFGY